MIRYIAVALIIAGCGGFGFSLAANHRKEVHSLRQLSVILDFMHCELSYRMTPLPELCLQASREEGGAVGEVFSRLSQELTCGAYPEVSDCMHFALAAQKDLPEATEKCLRLMGNSLGRYDLDGQLLGIQSVREACRKELDELVKNQDVRLRSYQTLGLCAGAAIAILLV